jgi:hypothetical protein
VGLWGGDSGGFYGVGDRIRVPPVILYGPEFFKRISRRIFLEKILKKFLPGHGGGEKIFQRDLP